MIARATLYPILAVPIAAGAPLGWLVLRIAGRGDPGGLVAWLGAELRGSSSLYAYLWVATTVVAVTLGAVTGRLSDRLEREALTDSLTGLRNRRFLEARLAEEMARARRYGGALAMLLIDLDHFKTINDAHGHDVGDAMLRRLGRLVSEEVRETDVAARPAGDEFAVLLPHGSIQEAATLAERLRTRAAERLDGATLSIGVAAFSPETHGSPRDFFRAVDQALYEAKAAGRNATRVA